VQREAPYQVGLDRLEQHVVVKQGIEAVNRRLAGRERSPLLYRKYRCAGRVNKPGSCQLPMLSAEVLEQAVLEVVLADLQERSRRRCSLRSTRRLSGVGRSWSRRLSWPRSGWPS
jgi:hypothetical protein